MIARLYHKTLAFYHDARCDHFTIKHARHGQLCDGALASAHLDALLKHRRALRDIDRKARRSRRRNRYV